jgi:hypothetical protein
MNGMNISALSSERLTELLQQQFHGRFRVQERRSGIYQIYAPYYHEDGDMMDVFVQAQPDGYLRVCDFGKTLMRLSYSFDLDTPNKQRIFEQILRQNFAKEDDGNIFIDTSGEQIFHALIQMYQVIGKISTMRLYKREVIVSMFREELEKFIFTQLQDYHPQEDFLPLDDENYRVDYRFNHRQRPIFLFAVSDSAQARLATISCLKFQMDKLSFKGAVVLSRLDAITRRDEERLLSAVDKTFPSLEDFEQHGAEYLERETVT